MKTSWTLLNTLHFSDFICYQGYHCVRQIVHRIYLYLIDNNEYFVFNINLNVLQRTPVILTELIIFSIRYAYNGILDNRSENYKIFTSVSSFLGIVDKLISIEKYNKRWISVTERNIANKRILSFFRQFIQKSIKIYRRQDVPWARVKKSIMDI